jgi:hypothetical protein
MAPAPSHAPATGASLENTYVIAGGVIANQTYSNMVTRLHRGVIV